MTTRDFDPLRLDLPRFAREGAELHGRWPLQRLSRVAECASPEAPVTDADVLVWSARGEGGPARGGEPQAAVHLRARTSIALVCQRCLGPVHLPLDIDRRFLFVHGEDAAAALDEASDDDVLAISRAFDLAVLIEDELLLAMPLVPRHEVCLSPLKPPDVPEVEEAASNPFAALAALKRDPRLN